MYPPLTKLPATANIPLWGFTSYLGNLGLMHREWSWLYIGQGIIRFICTVTINYHGFNDKSEVLGVRVNEGDVATSKLEETNTILVKKVMIARLGKLCSVCWGDALSMQLLAHTTNTKLMMYKIVLKINHFVNINQCSEIVCTVKHTHTALPVIQMVPGIS